MGSRWHETGGVGRPKSSPRGSVACLFMVADGSSARSFSGWGGQHSYYGLTWRPIEHPLVKSRLWQAG